MKQREPDRSRRSHQQIRRPSSRAFLPTTRAEMGHRGWSELDVLFVTGDAYVDHPSFGVPLLARVLEAEGLRVGILAQPDWRSLDDFRAMGRPQLFTAVSAGAMDSMVSNYTAAKRKRRDDAYSPGGKADRRPNRAVIAYTAAVKGAFKGVPAVIGGIEASLRRLAHYDYWDDAVRRSILVDSKADLLVFGMAETALVSIARRLSAGEKIGDIRDLPGTAWVGRDVPEGAVSLPSFEETAADKDAYGRAYKMAAEEDSHFTGRPLAQRHGDRTVVVIPPAPPLTEAQLDRLYDLPFTRLPHPSYTETIPAHEQIRFSITSHRGCFGGCAFCAISAHQGKTISSRSAASLAAEVDRLTHHPEFAGTVTDVGGPTANMYGLGCGDEKARRRCRRTSCLYPAPCAHLITDDRRLVTMLRELHAHTKVQHLFVASGVRHDLLERQPEYFNDLVAHHVGGLLKTAPESGTEKVTRVMRKPSPAAFEDFLNGFRDRTRRLGKRQAVVPYFMSGHPGTTLSDMVDVALFIKRHKLRVEQVQEFTPTPGTLATCIYYTGRDPYTGKEVYVPRIPRERRLQKSLLLWHLPENRDDVAEALRTAGREKERGRFGF